MTETYEIIAALVFLICAALFLRHVLRAVRMLRSGEAARLEAEREAREARLARMD